MNNHVYVYYICTYIYSLAYVTADMTLGTTEVVQIHRPENPHTRTNRPQTLSHAYMALHRWFGGIVFAIFTFCVARCIVCRNRNGMGFFLLPGSRYAANGALGDGMAGLSIEVCVCMYISVCIYYICVYPHTQTWIYMCMCVCMYYLQRRQVHACT